MYKTIFTLILCLSYILVFNNNSQAIIISPSTIDSETEYNVPKQHEITILNDESKKLDIQLFCWDLKFDKNLKKKYSPIPKDKDILAKYIEIPEKEFTLEPKESKKISFFIKVPESLKGGNIAVIFIRSKAPKSKFKNSSLSLSSKVGIPIIQSTKNLTEYKSKITSVNIMKKSTNAPLDFEMKVNNYGTGYIIGTGVVSIIDKKNKFLGSFELDKKIIPTKREVVMKKEILLSLDSGEYNALVTYNYKNKSISINKPFEIK